MVRHGAEWPPAGASPARRGSTRGSACTRRRSGCRTRYTPWPRAHARDGSGGRAPPADLGRRRIAHAAMGIAAVSVGRAILASALCRYCEHPGLRMLAIANGPASGCQKRGIRFLVERTGIGPVTPGLQSRCSPSRSLRPVLKSRRQRPLVGTRPARRTRAAHENSRRGDPAPTSVPLQPQPVGGAPPEGRVSRGRPLVAELEMFAVEHPLGQRPLRLA